jgi:hypothetical protein
LSWVDFGLLTLSLALAPSPPPCWKSWRHFTRPSVRAVLTSRIPEDSICSTTWPRRLWGCGTVPWINRRNLPRGRRLLCFQTSLSTGAGSCQIVSASRPRAGRGRAGASNRRGGTSRGQDSQFQRTGPYSQPEQSRHGRGRGAP